MLLSDVDCSLWIGLCADKPLSTYIQQQSLDQWKELALQIVILAWSSKVREVRRRWSARIVSADLQYD